MPPNPRRTLSPDSAAEIPITLVQAGVVPPSSLFFDYGLNFRYLPVLDGQGIPVPDRYEFVLDQNGYKIVDGTFTYLTDSTPDGIDDLVAIGYPVYAEGLYLNALDLTTIDLGAGNDSFSLAGAGISQSLTAVVDKFAAEGYIFQSNIFGGAGDDYVGALMPWFSFFDGGDSTPYSVGDVVDEDTGDLIYTVEQIPWGDTLELKGSRYDWDIEFKDSGVDGVTLGSILDGTDFIALSNNNRATAFERIRWGDSLFDLVVYPLQSGGFVYGQPDYFLLGGESVAPELNSSIAQGSMLWEAFQFSRTPLSGIAGVATALVDVYTGPGIDTPYLVGGNGTAALRFARLYTEQGNDIVWVQDVDQSSIELGAGNDSLEVISEFAFSVAAGGAGSDNIILGNVKNSQVFGEADDDVVELRGDSIGGLYDGGLSALDGDAIIFPGVVDSYSFSYYSAASDEDIVFFDTASNRYVQFELYRFSDSTLSVSELKDRAQLIETGTSPVAPGVELIGEQSVVLGDAADYALYLSSPLVANGSIELSLNSVGITAEAGVDFERLTDEKILASPGVSLGEPTVNPVSKQITFSVANSSGSDLPLGAQLISFSVQTFRSSLGSQSDKSFAIELVTANNAPSLSSLVTAIIDSSSPSPGGGDGGGLVLPDLPARPEIPAPPPELADDAERDLLLPDGGKLITEGPVRNGVQILVGSAFQDVLVGGLESDFLDGAASSDTYTGGPNQDVFRHLYGDPAPDLITDFASGGDRLQIGAVPLLSSLGRRLNGRTQWKKALAQTSGLKAGKRSKAFFVHQPSSGRIYFNANRTDRGWGREGGLVVTIPAGERFTWKDLQFDYGTASSADSLASLL